MHLIRNHEEYREALAELESIFHATPGTPEGDRLEVLMLFIEAWEKIHYPAPKVTELDMFEDAVERFHGDAIDISKWTPIDAIKFVLASRKLTRKDIEPYLGAETRVSEVLSGKRGLSLEMIRRLYEGLKIPLAILIRPSKTQPKRKTSTAKRRKSSTASARAA